MGVVKSFVSGASAPSSPDFCKKSNFLQPITIEMIDWYYRTPSTVKINYYDLDDRCSVVEICEKYSSGDIHIKSETIGPRTKQLIVRNYVYYNECKIGTNPQ